MPAPSFFRTAQLMRGLLFGVVGLLILAVAAFEVTHRLEFLEVAQAVDGQVERLNAGGSHPQVAFTTATGQRVSYPQGGMIFGYEPGQPVRVLYDPARLRLEPVLDTFGALWGMTVVWVLLGLAFVGACVRGLLRRR